MRSSTLAWRRGGRGLRPAPGPAAGRRGRRYDGPVDGDAAARLRAAIEMHELAERMMRQRLRRERPQISASELESQIGAWLRDRPGAEHGDAAGRRPSGSDDRLEEALDRSSAAWSPAASVRARRRLRGLGAQRATVHPRRRPRRRGGRRRRRRVAVAGPRGERIRGPRRDRAGGDRAAGDGAPRVTGRTRERADRRPAVRVVRRRGRDRRRAPSRWTCSTISSCPSPVPAISSLPEAARAQDDETRPGRRRPARPARGGDPRGPRARTRRCCDIEPARLRQGTRPRGGARALVGTKRSRRTLVAAPARPPRLRTRVSSLGQLARRGEPSSGRDAR